MPNTNSSGTTNLWAGVTLIVAILAFIAVVAIFLPTGYKSVDDALRVWPLFGVLIGLVVGAVPTYFVANKATASAETRASTAESNLQAANAKANDVQDSANRRVDEVRDSAHSELQTAHASTLTQLQAAHDRAHAELQAVQHRADVNEKAFVLTAGHLDPPTWLGLQEHPTIKAALSANGTSQTNDLVAGKQNGTAAPTG
jgi:gas vesicle protein